MLSIIHGGRARLLAGCCAVALLPAAPSWAQQAVQMQEMTVTGTREGQLKSETPAAVTTIGKDTIADTKPAHAMELMTRVPGAAIMVTNGEGHTTGIRHPIGTAQVYLYMEDGVPTRAPGFFNHNALFEINLPQAGGIEIMRGPGSALQGSDAIGAVFNVLTNAPSDAFESKVTAETGSYAWNRMLATSSNTWGNIGARGDLNVTHTDGWRDHTGYDRQSATLRVDGALPNGASLKGVITGSNVEMQTGANARLTKNDYIANPTNNYHSIAYRNVQSMRASLAYEQEIGASLISLTPFIRSNRMEMNPSFQLSSDPVISLTGHDSIGLQAKYRRDFAPWRTRLIVGTDFDYSHGIHVEDRIMPFKNGEYFTGYSTTGKIYNYTVDYTQISPYIHAETSPISKLRLEAGLRYDIISFDYDNHMDSGSFQTRVSSSTTRTFYRPSNDTRHFSHLSPSLGATYSIVPEANVFGRYKHSFRTPGESDMFRSGRDPDSTQLKPVTVNTYELGLKGPDKGPFSYEVSAYYMLKQNDILSTTASDSVPRQSNNGKTLHRGIELAAGWQVLPEWHVGGNTSYSRHTYRRWFTATSTAYSGNEIPTAPNVVSNAQITWTPNFVPGLRAEAEWTHIGPYKMDDANTNTYQGHHLFNVRAAYKVVEGFEVFGRVMNLADTRWATIAQYTNSREEFAPGLPRTVYGGVTVRF